MDQDGQIILLLSLIFFSCSAEPCGEGCSHLQQVYHIGSDLCIQLAYAANWLKMSFLLLQAILMDVWIIVLSAYAKRRRK